ncbi:prenyltransferase, partial [Rhizobiaceae sp. 2RAB30]
REAGRQIILATGTPRKFADAIAAHLGLFDAVIATEGRENITAGRKRAVLTSAYGDGGFDYVGNSRHDLKVFDAAREAIVVAPDRQAARWQATHRCELLETPKPTWRT